MTKIAALPFDYEYPRARLALVVIDMQRDFVEPGGFGASLGNDVTRLQAIVPALKGLIAACRTAGVPVIHTRECHQPDMSDCPPAKRDRGEPSLRIGDPGPMGRVLIAGEPGAEIIPDLAPLPGETVIDKPGQMPRDKDCGDFQTWQEAQGFFETAKPGDPHRLDGDRDGIACESLRH